MSDILCFEVFFSLQFALYDLLLRCGENERYYRDGGTRRCRPPIDFGVFSSH